MNKQTSQAFINAYISKLNNLGFEISKSDIQNILNDILAERNWLEDQAYCITELEYQVSLLCDKQSRKTVTSGDQGVSYANNIMLSSIGISKKMNSNTTKTEYKRYSDYVSIESIYSRSTDYASLYKLYFAKVYRELDHSSIQSFDYSVKIFAYSIISKYLVETGKRLNYDIVIDAIHESLTKTQEFKYITQAHYRVIKTIIKRESARGIKSVDIANIETISEYSYTIDDLNTTLDQDIMLEILNLDQKDKQMIEYIMFGYDYNDIAKVLNMTVANIQIRMFRIRENLDHISDINSAIDQVYQISKDQESLDNKYGIDQSILNKKKKQSKAYNQYQIALTNRDKIANRLSLNEDIKTIAQSYKIKVSTIRLMIKSHSRLFGNIASKYIQTSSKSNRVLNSYTVIDTQENYKTW